jgi:hypothetical protein
MTEETKVAPGQPVDPTAATAPAPEANGQAAPDLNLNDLSALRSILDVASSRGAFKAAEMEAVGKVYNKLSAFLDSVTAKKE